MVAGIIFALTAGVLISIQGAMNSSINSKIGNLETVLLAHLLGLAAAIIAVIAFGNGDFRKINEVKPIYLIAGPLGVLIVYGVIHSISILGASLSMALVLVAQLLIAVLIDNFGLFGLKKIPFDITKFIGIAVMILGIIIFKIKK